ncbi:MAG: hypothetical protein WDM87_02715 [Terracidiphilus sp.]
MRRPDAHNVAGLLNGRTRRDVLDCIFARAPAGMDTRKDADVACGTIGEVDET